jgi:DNA-binding transcriptional ArsR family regulator
VKPALPPSYVNTPVALAYAEADDALIVTMTRILGLCWAYDYERTPALRPEQVAELTSRPRSTLYRHLKQLREMGWIRVDQAGRRIIIRPVVVRSAKAAISEAGNREESVDETVPNKALFQVLAEIGVENPKRTQLACLDIDPLWVRAWHLWANHPHRHSLTNPVGNVILKLESGERPPGEFLTAAEREEERLRLRQRDQEPNGQGEAPGEQGQAEAEDDDVPEEIRRLWARSLEELKLQMTKATFDTWLRGSEVIEASDGRLTIMARHPHAVDWLQNRLLPVIERTVARHMDHRVKITFVADP